MPLQTFDDVAPGDFAYHYIEALVAAGVTGGTSVSPPLYSPNAACTIAQLFVFLVKGRAANDPTFEFKDARMPELWEDVARNHWAFEWIQRATKLGIPGGPERASFDPGDLQEAQQVTRGWAAIFIVRALRELELNSAKATFPVDVPKTHAYYGYVERLAALGITAGTAFETYGVNSLLTRAQMAVFIVKAFDLPFVTENPPEQ